MYVQYLIIIFWFKKVFKDKAGHAAALSTKTASGSGDVDNDNDDIVVMWK